jgi:hypothetical protein
MCFKILTSLQDGAKLGEFLNYVCAYCMRVRCRCGSSLVICGWCVLYSASDEYLLCSRSRAKRDCLMLMYSHRTALVEGSVMCCFVEITNLIQYAAVASEESVLLQVEFRFVILICVSHKSAVLI